MTSQTLSTEFGDDLPVSPQPDVVPARPVDDRVLNAEAFANLTGVRAERLRTWQRRHRFPAPAADAQGHRGFRAVDAPRVVAARQLIEAGEPVAEAIAQVRDLDHAQIDIGSLQRAFGSAATPVVAIGGPSPLEIVWANDAALASLPAGGAELPYELSDRSAYWRRLLIDAPSEPVWLAHAPWFEPQPEVQGDAGPDPVSAVAWSVGAPAFVPAVLVVIDVPVSEETPAPPPKPEERAVRASEHRCASAVGAARRALQRGTGRQALADALGALVTSGLCTDAVLLVSRAGELRPALSSCGRHELMRPTAATDAGLRLAIHEDRPIHVDGPAIREELAIEPHEHALAAPLVAAGRDYGYLVAITTEPVDVTDDCDTLVMALAANLAASMSRNRALQELRRLTG